MSLTTIGSREARQKWRDLLDAAYTGAADTVIERNGKPIAAVIPYPDYLALMERLDELRAARRVGETFQAWKQSPEQSRLYTEILRELDLKKVFNG